MMLDLAIRDSTHGNTSLREVLQWMNANYAQKSKFFDESNGVRAAAETMSHADLGWFFAKYVCRAGELPWDDFLRSAGLRVEAVNLTVPDPGFVASRNFDGPMSVASVNPGSEADRAGLQVGDLILELLGKPAGQESRQALSRLKLGDTLTVKIRSRRTGERELKWKIGSRQEITYQVKDLDHVTPEQHARRVAWLRGEAESANSSSEATGTAK